MGKTLAISIIIICFFSTAKAENAFIVVGPGLATCDRFSEEASKGAQIETFFFSWGQGWMSAANLMLSIAAGNPSTTNLAAMSIDEQLLHVRIYCQENPLKYYEAAIIDLYDSMRRTQGLPGWITALTNSPSS